MVYVSSQAAEKVGPQRRIPSLDGIRAISILLVISSHLALSNTLPVAKYLWRFDLGNLGVRVFFVISGFLITSILMREKASSGQINLKNFYIRRIFRIVPAYYTMLIILALLAWLGFFRASVADFSSAILYFSNYRTLPFPIAHSWSLSVEEQFYLLWPAALVLLGTRRAAWYSAGFLLVSPLLRVAAAASDHWPVNPRYAFETVADALATGCLLAVCRHWLWDLRFYRSVLSSRIFPFVAVLILMTRGLRLPEVLWEAVGASACNGVTAMLLDRYMRMPSGPVGIVLNSRPIVFLGVLSYSLYLWQQVFLYDRHALNVPFNLLCIAAAALASYYLIERPGMRLGRRLVRGQD